MTQPESYGCTCGTTTSRRVLLYACSGAANVAEIADRAARRLAAEGVGQMYCLAGLGAGIPNMIQTASYADLNLVLDGCHLDCARLIFQKAGLTNVRVIRITDHGINKVKGVKVTEEQVQKVVDLAKQELAAA